MMHEAYLASSIEFSLIYNGIFKENSLKLYYGEYYGEYGPLYRSLPIPLRPDTYYLLTSTLQCIFVNQ